LHGKFNQKPELSQYDVAAAIAAANPLYVEILPWLPVKSLV